MIEKESGDSERERSLETKKKKKKVSTMSQLRYYFYCSLHALLEIYSVRTSHPLFGTGDEKRTSLRINSI